MSKEEQKNSLPELFDSELKLMKLALKMLNEERKKVLPEHEYLFCAFASLVFSSSLIKHSIFPQEVQHLEKVLWNRLNLFLVIYVIVAMGGVADGARRIVKERTPYYRAFVRVFLLGKVLRGSQ